MNRYRVIAPALGMAVSLIAVACVGEQSGEIQAYPAEHGAALAVSVIDSAGESPVTIATDSMPLIQPGQLATVSAATVLNWTGPRGKPFEVQIRIDGPSAANARRFGMITLRNSARERSPDLGQYPCTSCHLGRGMTLRDQRIADAHQNIKADHPAQTGATCATCHAANNVELLALKNGERATLDHAYRVCAQCHFPQAEAWAGGAHGKRLDGWQGRRVVMGCADCHDPHQPAVGTRIPFRAPQLERPPFRRP
jgi:nitrate/TMAO reductase-like tetraheme cytochrome c subunit